MKDINEDSKQILVSWNCAIHKKFTEQRNIQKKIILIFWIFSQKKIEIAMEYLH